VVVRRENSLGGTDPGAYDPFDEDDSLSVAAQMPTVDSLTQQDANSAAVDPFEADDAAQQYAAKLSEAEGALPGPTDEPDSGAEVSSEYGESSDGALSAEEHSADNAQEAPPRAEKAKASTGSEPSPKPKSNLRTANPLRDEQQGAAGEVVSGMAEALPRANELREVVGSGLRGELAGGAAESDGQTPDGSTAPEFDFDDLESHLQAAPEESYRLPPLTPEQLEARRQELERERLENERDCQEILKIVKQRDIESISLDIRLKGTPGEDIPFGCGLGAERFAPRSWPEITYLWKASALCHKPLRFEQTQLERYGHDCGPVLQPIVSGAHFFATLPLLPYSMGIESPNECIYTLGYYRPGSCAPYMIPAFPFTWRAALYEGAAWTGGVFLFP